MARILLCILLAASAVACDGGDVERLQDRLAAAAGRAETLETNLERARDRSRELERDLIHRSDVDRARFADLWHGGPTIGGTFLALPRLGKMRWTCRDDFGFRIVFEPAGATVQVDLEDETAAAGRHGPLHPGQTLGATIRAGETVTWTITHRHKPGLIRAHVRVTAGRSKHGSCLLPLVGVRQTSRTYD